MFSYRYYRCSDPGSIWGIIDIDVKSIIDVSVIFERPLGPLGADA